MIGLISTGWADAMVPLDAITRVGNTWKNDHRVKMRTVELNDGRKFDLTDTQADVLQGRAVQIIPALPGVSLLVADLAPTLAESCIMAEPVIAWALCLDGDVRPVTPYGVLSGRSIWDDHYVEMAGTIQSVGDLTEPPCFSDRAEMLQHFFAVEYAKKNGADGFVSELDADVAPQAPELDRLIANYLGAGDALIAGNAIEAGISHDDPLAKAYLTATEALDAYQPVTLDEFVRSLAARFNDDAPPTDAMVSEIVTTARRLAGELAA